MPRTRKPHPVLDRPIDSEAVRRMLAGPLPPRPVRWARNRWGRLDRAKFLAAIAKQLGYDSVEAARREVVGKVIRLENGNVKQVDATIPPLLDNQVGVLL